MANRVITEFTSTGAQSTQADFKKTADEAQRFGDVAAKAFDRLSKSAKDTPAALRVTDAAIKDIRGSVDAAAARLGPLGSALTALGPGGAIAAAATAAAIGGFVELTKRAIDTASALKDTSEQLGLSTDTLQELKFAAGQAGIEQEKLDQGLRVFTKNVGEARDGQGSLASALKDTDAAFLKTLRSTTSTDEALDLVLHKLGDTKDATERAALAQAAFGRTGVQLSGIVNDGAQSLDEMRQKAHALGLVISADLVAKGDEADDALRALKETVAAELAGAFLKLAPTITEVAKGLTSFAVTAGGTLPRDLDAIASELRSLDAAMPDWLRRVLEGGTPADAGAKLFDIAKAGFDAFRQGGNRFDIEDAISGSASHAFPAQQLGFTQNPLVDQNGNLGQSFADVGAKAKSGADGVAFFKSEMAKFAGSLPEAQRASEALRAELASIDEKFRTGALSEADANRLKAAAQDDYNRKLDTYAQKQAKHGQDEAARNAQEVAQLQAEVAARQRAIESGASLAEEEGLVAEARALATGKLPAEAAAIRDATTAQAQQNDVLRQLKQAEAQNRDADRDIALNQQKAAIYAEVAAAGGTVVDAERKIAAAEAAGKVPAQGLTDAYEALRKKSADTAATLFDSSEKVKASNENLALTAQNKDLTDEIDLLQQVADHTLTYAQAEEQLAVNRAKVANPGVNEALVRENFQLQKRHELIQQTLHDTDAELRQLGQQTAASLETDLSTALIDSAGKGKDAFQALFADLVSLARTVAIRLAEILVIRPLLDASGLSGLLNGGFGLTGGGAGAGAGGGSGGGLGGLLQTGSSLVGLGQKAFSLGESLGLVGSTATSTADGVAGLGLSAANADLAASAFAVDLGDAGLAAAAFGVDATSASIEAAALGVDAVGGAFSGVTGALAGLESTLAAIPVVGWVLLGAIAVATSAISELNANSQKNILTQGDWIKAYEGGIGKLLTGFGAYLTLSGWISGGSFAGELKTLGAGLGIGGALTKQWTDPKAFTLAILDPFQAFFAAMAHLPTKGTAERQDFRKFLGVDSANVFNAPIDRNAGQEDISAFQKANPTVDYQQALAGVVSQEKEWLGLTTKQVDEAKALGVVFQSLLGDKAFKGGPHALALTQEFLANAKLLGLDATQTMEGLGKAVDAIGGNQAFKGLGEQVAAGTVSFEDARTAAADFSTVLFRNVPLGVNATKIAFDDISAAGAVTEDVFVKVRKDIQGASEAAKLMVDAFKSIDLTGISVGGVIDQGKLDAAVDDFAAKFRRAVADAMEQAIIDGIIQSQLQPQLFAPFFNKVDDINARVASGDLSLSDAQGEYAAAISDFDANLAKAEPGIRAMITAGAHVKDSLDKWADSADNAAAAADAQAEVARGYNASIAQQIQDFRDPAGKDQRALDRSQQARFDQAAAVGADLVQVQVLGYYEQLDALDKLRAKEVQAQEERIRAVQQERDAIIAARKQILDAYNQLTASPSSPLAPQVAYANAKAHYDALVAKADGGDVAALQEIPGSAQDVLGLARTLYASGPEFADIFNNVTGTLDRLGLDTSLPALPTPGDDAIITSIDAQKQAVTDRLDRLIELTGGSDNGGGTNANFKPGRYGLSSGGQQRIAIQLASLNPSSPSTGALGGFSGMSAAQIAALDPASTAGKLRDHILELFPDLKHLIDTGQLKHADRLFHQIAQALYDKILHPEVVQSVLGFDVGGIVRKPTLGVFGENGPEAVVPLSRAAEFAAAIPQAGDVTAQLAGLGRQLGAHSDLARPAAIAGLQRGDELLSALGRATERGSDSIVRELRELRAENVAMRGELVELRRVLRPLGGGLLAGNR